MFKTIGQCKIWGINKWLSRNNNYLPEITYISHMSSNNEEDAVDYLVKRENKLINNNKRFMYYSEVHEPVVWATSFGLAVSLDSRNNSDEIPIYWWEVIRYCNEIVDNLTRGLPKT